MSYSIGALSEQAKTLYDSGQSKVVEAMSSPDSKTPGQIMKLLQEGQVLTSTAQSGLNHIKTTADRISRMGS